MPRLSNAARTYDRIKNAVLESLLDFLPAGVARTRMLSCSLKEAYVSKMVSARARTVSLKGDGFLKPKDQFEKSAKLCNRPPQLGPMPVPSKLVKKRPSPTCPIE